MSVLSDTFSRLFDHAFTVVAAFIAALMAVFAAAAVPQHAEAAGPIPYGEYGLNGLHIWITGDERAALRGFLAGPSSGLSGAEPVTLSNVSDGHGDNMQKITFIPIGGNEYYIKCNGAFLKRANVDPANRTYHGAEWCTDESLLYNYGRWRIEYFNTDTDGYSAYTIGSVNYHSNQVDCYLSFYASYDMNTILSNPSLQHLYLYSERNHSHWYINSRVYFNVERFYTNDSEWNSQNGSKTFSSKSTYVDRGDWRNIFVAGNNRYWIPQRIIIGDFGTLGVRAPAITGYDFIGWYTSTSGGTKVWDAYSAYGRAVESSGFWQRSNGSFIWVNYNDSNMYPRYSVHHYTIKFNGNGATSGSMSNETYSYDVSKALYGNNFARGYKVTYKYNDGRADTSATCSWGFTGWNRASNGSSTGYSNCQRISNLTSTNNATINLYAQWKSGSVSLPNPTRDGYAFKGWYSDSALTKKVGDGGASYSTGSAITLYAKWEPLMYNVVYHTNRGTGSDVTIKLNINNISTDKILYPTDARLNYTRGYDSSTKRYDYQFRCWSTTPVSDSPTSTNWTRIDPNVTLKTYKDSGKLDVAANKTIHLYAVWDATFYNVKYHANGGSGSDYQIKMYLDNMSIDKVLASTDSNLKYTRGSDNSLNMWEFRKWSASPDNHAEAADNWKKIDPGTTMQTCKNQGLLDIRGGETVDLYAVWDPYVYFFADGDSLGKYKNAYLTNVPEAIWNDRTEAARKANTRGEEKLENGLSPWSTTSNAIGISDEDGSLITWDAFDQSSIIDTPKVFYTHNSVRYCYGTTSDSSILNTDYTFYLDDRFDENSQQLQLDGSNLYSYYAPGNNTADESHSAFTWYGWSITLAPFGYDDASKAIPNKTVYTDDISPRSISSDGIYTTKESSATNKHEAGDSITLESNKVFYVHWPWAVYDGVTSSW